MSTSADSIHRSPRLRGAQTLEAGLGARLGRTHRVMRSAWQERIADLGLSPPQAALLRAVGEWPGSGLRELSRRLGTDAMNTKRLADHLEDRGLLRCTSDPAHRQRRIFDLTDEGAALAGEVSSRAFQWNRDLGAMVGANELALLQELLALLESALESAGSSRPSNEEEWP